MQSGEDRLIAKYFQPLATAAGALSLTDDAAVYAPPEGHEIVLKTDAIVAGVHFLPDDPPDSIGRKALRVNLSDLAAKGAQPAGCLMTLALPDGTDDRWLEAFASGLKADCEQFTCPLYGGDTVRGPLAVSIFAFGIVPQGTMVRRAGAKVGDRIFVTGSIGDATLGLKLARDKASAAKWAMPESEAGYLIRRYRIPQPRVPLAAALRATASAAMDVSDGLVGDLAKLCDASGVSARIQTTSVPLSAGARRALTAEPGLLEAIVTGGDDYEVLCTITPERVGAFSEFAQTVDIPVTDIGEIIKGDGPPEVIGADGARLTFKQGSYSHF